MLSKQSIRGNLRIYIDGEPTTKDQLISMSKSWSENQEILFLKLLKQGGKFKMKGKLFDITAQEQLTNSQGIVDSAAKPMDYDDDGVDQNYLR